MAYPKIVNVFIKDLANINVYEPEVLDPARVFFVGSDADETVDSIREKYDMSKSSGGQKEYC